MQGLIDVHPDVDAICRQTQPLGDVFDEHLPSVVRAFTSSVSCKAGAPSRCFVHAGER